MFGRGLTFSDLSGLLFLNWGLHLLKGLILDIHLRELLFLNLKLETDDALDLTEVLLNGKELIHEAQLQLIFLILKEGGGATQTFND